MAADLIVRLSDVVDNMREHVRVVDDDVADDEKERDHVTTGSPDPRKNQTCM